MNWRNVIYNISYNIIILPLAMNDIYEHTNYIAHKLQSPHTALNIAKDLRNTIDSLRIFPHRHKLDDDIRLSSLGIRKIYYKKYKIFFLIKHDTIYILRVIHTLENSDNVNKIIKGFRH